MKKFKNFWKKIGNYIKYLFTHPKTSLPAFIIAETIFWIPVWVPALLAIIINPWWWTVATAVIIFWAGPITPAIPLQIGFILLVERIIVKIFSKKKQKKEEDKQC